MWRIFFFRSFIPSWVHIKFESFRIIYSFTFPLFRWYLIACVVWRIAMFTFIKMRLLCLQYRKTVFLLEYQIMLYYTHTHSLTHIQTSSSNNNMRFYSDPSSSLLLYHYWKKIVFSESKLTHSPLSMVFGFFTFIFFCVIHLHISVHFYQNGSYSVHLFKFIHQCF